MGVFELREKSLREISPYGGSPVGENSYGKFPRTGNLPVPGEPVGNVSMGVGSVSEYFQVAWLTKLTIAGSFILPFDSLMVRQRVRTTSRDEVRERGESKEFRHVHYAITGMG